MPSCENCGAELPAGARFCPQCAAPVPPEAFDGVEPEPPARPNLRGVAERVLFAVLLLAFAGFVIFVVLVVGFGFLVEGSAL